MKKIKLIAIIVGLTVLLISCARKDVSIMSKSINFENYFKGFTGTFVLQDLSCGRDLKYNETNFSNQDSPFSTFKILHSLIALQTGVLKDENSVIKWDGTIYPTEEWNKDQTLKSALKNSVVWYFQETARKIGRETMQSYLNRVNFGNKIIGDKIDWFWLDDSLKISVSEQLEFITKLYKEELPFDKKVIRTVKKVIINEDGDGYILSGKTGTSDPSRQPCLGWYVGYIESNKKVYSFVTKIEGNSEARGPKAKEITCNILKDLGLMK
jgi:beta-lactamase class D